jgi:ArsR family metal-binding transcriptional regulator
MMEKSHCFVYVLRADQRDYSKDLEIIKPMLENDEQNRKIILAVNFADKIEPISRSTPFIPNIKQIENIEKKLIEIQKIFGIPKNKVIFYSATEGYNLGKISKGIVDILKSTVQTGKEEPTHIQKVKAIYVMTSQDNCGECGCTNCYQFSMQAASSKNRMALSDCPYIDEDEAEEFYSSLGGDEMEVDNGLIILKNTKMKIKCPSCGSQKVHKEKKGFRTGMLLFGIFGAISEGINSQQTQFVCEKCGNTWD